jgi:hypothetical protein
MMELGEQGWRLGVTVLVGSNSKRNEPIGSVGPIRLAPDPQCLKTDDSVVIEWGSFMISLRRLHWRG